jgi:hypothetical protein
LALEPSKTKLVAFGRFAQRDANNGGKRRPETIYFLGFTLYCTRNRKGNFRVGMRIEKSRFRRSIDRLQDLMRRQRHLPIPDQAASSVSEIRCFAAKQRRPPVPMITAAACDAEKFSTCRHGNTS